MIVWIHNYTVYTWNKTIELWIYKYIHHMECRKSFRIEALLYYILFYYRTKKKLGDLFSIRLFVAHYDKNVPLNKWMLIVSFVLVFALPHSSIYLRMCLFCFTMKANQAYICSKTGWMNMGRLGLKFDSLGMAIWFTQYTRIVSGSEFEEHGHAYKILYFYYCCVESWLK